MEIKKLITTGAIGVGLVAPVFQVSQSQMVQAAAINDVAKQNSYSGVTYLHKMLQAQGIRYNKFYAHGNKIKYRKGKPEGIVIHETATPGASAYNEAIYFNREWKNMYSYVHAFVDHKQVIQMMTPNYGVWGAGAVANNRFIQVELCEENTRDKFAKSVNNDAIYVAKLLHRYGIEPVNATKTGKGTIWSHHAVTRFLGGTNHTDPDNYFAKWGYSMDDFFDLIKHYYDQQAGDNSNLPDPGSIDNSAADANAATGHPIDGTTANGNTVNGSTNGNAANGTPATGTNPAGGNTNGNSAGTANGANSNTAGSNTVQDGVGEASASANSQSSTGTKTLMHDAYTYDGQGNRLGAQLMTAGTTVEVTGTKLIKNRRYLQIGEDKYVVASNIAGRLRTLHHNAYIYDTAGLRATKSKLLRGKTVRTYGGRVRIGGKMYYPISAQRFVKAANFK